ncbi:ABC transporter substrate-binding protein [Streptomyces sp. TS71-3]|uniref:ABC transporter substrate-binding protein n=1 Tax=Streptomyces sp. TS71-3 TaxID=2733862 RepID=UPI001BB38FA7|nr:ABC transporter substrate-binding protein [Streptomyces sp. TS71-3]
MTARRLRRTAVSTVTPHRPRRFTLRAGALALCAALSAACGVLPGTSGGSGAPITVMTWAPEDTKATNKPGMPAMAQAYARWANATGGLGGHHLNVLTCNEHNTTVGAAECARRAVAAKAVAVVGSYSQYSRSFLGPLEAAGIPYVGGYGLTDEEFSSPLSYPVNGGQPALMAGNGRQLAATCARIALVRPDTIAGDNLPQLLDAGLHAGGHTAATDIRTAEDATSYDTQADHALEVASGTGGTGCVSTVLGDRTDTFADSFRRARDDYPKVKVSSVLGSVDQSAVDRTGGATSPYEGAYVTGWYPVLTDARWNPMRDVISKYAFGDNRIDAADAGVQTTWIAYTVLRKAVESLGNENVTANTLRHAFDNGLKVETGGLTPPLRWDFSDLLAAPDFPRLVNADVTFQQVRDGRLVAERKGFVNVSNTLESAS